MRNSLKDTTDQSGRRRPWVLALAALGLVVGCDPDVAPPFAVEGTGSVTGLLFFDENRDGLYDPAAGDVALSDVGVVLLSRGTEEVLPGGTTQTGANGRFSLSDVPLGTHDLLIDETTLPDFATVCQNPLPVTVYGGESEYEDVAARQSCLITIAEAEQLDPAAGEFVTVSGIVTSFPGQIDNSYTQIEDETGGIRIFSSALQGTDPAIEIGDRIEVSGTVGEFGGELQISGAVTLNAHEEDVAVVVPELVTTAEITAAGAESDAELQGRLVRVENVEITAGFGSGTLNEQNALINDGSGTTIVRVEDGVVSDRGSLPTLFPAGSCYDITGVVGSFNGEGQIFPRSTDDMVAVECN